MKKYPDATPYRHTGAKKFKIKQAPTSVKRLYSTDAELEKKLDSMRGMIDELQQRMYAQDRHGLLLIFQAMDAAGKDGTIRAVMKGVNPTGMEIHNFKRPSEEELDHDFLWRCAKMMTPRGRIGIFNRSYYEEVLVCRVHPEIITQHQRLPEGCTADLERLFEDRLKAMRHYENYLDDNGIRVVKFFLNVSKDEQKRRFLSRIAERSKNWKFNAADVKERQHWDAYMRAYEAAINGSASKRAPWYAIPADDKGTMRLLVLGAILRELEALDLQWPKLPVDQQNALAECRKMLLEE